MTASHLKAEQDIKQRLLSVSRLCDFVSIAFSFCLTLQISSYFNNENVTGEEMSPQSQGPS